MLRAAFKGNFQEQIYGINQLSPTSPLFWEEGALEALVDTVEAGVPLAILPEPNAGMSAPYTLAGLLTMNNAECLSGLVITQLLNPGHKVIYANSWTTTDMKSGAALVGSTERHNWPIFIMFPPIPPRRIRITMPTTNKTHGKKRLACSRRSVPAMT
jgi:trimethylamine:corrinoid methyltransferase-like protein